MKIINNKTLLYCTIFFLIIIQSVSAQDTLLLYTKSTCSNCEAVKRTLINNHINFIEMDLADQNNAIEMLRKLRTVKYSKDILLPVVFVNNQLFHPAYQTSKELITLDIANVMDTLLQKSQRGELHFTNFHLAQKPTTTTQNTHSDTDCSMQNTTPIVLVVAEYKTITDAESAMQKLIQKGYSYAGIACSKGVYRVYNKLFLKHEIAEQEHKNALKNNPNCYLLSIAK